MNTNSDIEAKWVAERLKIYTIKYVEIYNEIYDHIVSAIEETRRQGDDRAILPIFQDIIDRELGGYRGIERLNEIRPRQVNSFLIKSLNHEFISYFTTRKIVWFLIPMILLIAAATLGKWSPNAIFFMIFCLSLLPIAYFVYYGIANRYFRSIRSRRKRSLVNSSMLHICTTIMILFNAFNHLIPALVSFFVDKEWVEISRGIVAYLGISGMSLLAAFAFVYVKSIFTIMRSDYDRMIREVIPVTH